jgi:flavin-binding protein dodecin
MKTMSVARITEISAASTIGFEDAIKTGIDRAVKTLKNVKGAWIQDQEIVVDEDKVTEYRVHMKVTFILSG